jgi:hypothetical protein
MRQVTCAACRAQVPMNEAFSIADRSLCRKCAEQFVSEQRANKQVVGTIARQVDPTICVHCSADSGDDEWAKVAELPACTKCENFFRNRPYPRWLKISFAVFLCIAAAAFVYNLRFFLAYVDMIKGDHAMKERKFEQTVDHFASAADRLPEMPELAVIPNMYRAQRLMVDEKYPEALALIEKSRSYAPPDMRGAFRDMEITAQIGLAFDRRDYDSFLDLSQQWVKTHPGESSGIASVASAYACKYAASSDPQFRDAAMKNLELAKGLAGEHMDEFKEYENRILHRLQTREIITRQQFKKRFPTGWKLEGGK